MKFIRASTCSLKHSTASKKRELKNILAEYGRVVNIFIQRFWNDAPSKTKLLKNIIEADTWLSARLRKVAAREAIDMILSQKKKNKHKAVIPKHRGNRMCVSSTIAELQRIKRSKTFDSWLHLSSIGEKIIINLPVTFHKHFNRLARHGKRLNAYIITKDSVQFCFEIETEPKKTEGIEVGCDTGINALATLSNGQQYGTDIKQHVERIKRCKHGSNGQRRARRALRQRMDEVAKQVIATPDLKTLVVEKLSNLNYQSKLKRRLSKNIRRSIGAWAWRYWLSRLQMMTESNRVAFRTVHPTYTSQRCSSCGYTDRNNRNLEYFRCLNCSYEGNADSNAAQNILMRYLFVKEKFTGVECRESFATVPVANLKDVQKCAGF